MKAIASSRNIRSKKKHPLNARAFLDSTGLPIVQWNFLHWNNRGLIASKFEL